MLDMLGRGGMAIVYRARDTASDVTVALKVGHASKDGHTDPRCRDLFEREFHTLNQLAHPRIVRAFDYGLEGDTPYYTMELLDGGNAGSRAPMPWREACVMAYDVCSALSLLHSRRLLHRDLTPKNVLCTGDGTAKLIDFGLLSSFGPAAIVGGTPPYVAPEVLNSTGLDGRSDLFSLGATLYKALTGRAPFAAQRFEQLRDRWRTPPAPLAQAVDGVPQPLDELVMALLRIDVNTRPKGVAEVMDRLRPLLPSPPAEDLRFAKAYLVAPELVGRKDHVARLRGQLQRTTRRRGGGVVIVGAPGTGRTRMLDAFALEAKLLGMVTARIDAADAGKGPFGVAKALVGQLHRAAPLASLRAARADPQTWRALFPSGSTDAEQAPLADVAELGEQRAQLHTALRNWLIRLCRRQAVALMVDDLEHADEPSAAFIAALSLDAPRHRLAYAVTARTNATGGVGGPLAILRERGAEMRLEPLSRDQMGELLTGVFGDVPHLFQLVRRVHELSGGRPRDCMTVAQHLVNVGAANYEGGAWSLPERPEGKWLPPSMEAALATTLEALSPEAVAVARALEASVLPRLGRPALVAVTQLERVALDRGVAELRSLQLLAGDAEGYALTNDEAGARLLVDMAPARKVDLHDGLGAHYLENEPLVVLSAYHHLQGSAPDNALERILATARTIEERGALTRQAVARIGASACARTLELAVACAHRQRRPDRDLLPLWEMLADLSTKGAGLDLYARAQAPLLARLQRDSGYCDWQALQAVDDPAERAARAFQLAVERHQAESEQTRGLHPRDAMRSMAHFVGLSIMVSARGQDQALLASLPPLLEPFAPLNPMVAHMQKNAAIAVISGLGRNQEAYERYTALAGSRTALGTEYSYQARRGRVHGALARARFLAVLGIAPDEETDEADEPNELITREYIRKIVALHEGDGPAAQAHGRMAELLALRHRSGPLLATLNEELEAHALSRDLEGLKTVRRRIAATAQAHPGWRGAEHLADAYYHQLCGDPTSALAAAEQALSTPKVGGVLVRTVVPAGAVAVEALVELGQVERAVAQGHAGLKACQEEQRPHFGRQIALALALAEAKRGDYDKARRRVLGVQEQQRALGVRGLLAARTAEHLARIAIWAGERQAFETAARAAADAYRVTAGSLPGGSYQRLLDDAGAAGIRTDGIQIPTTTDAARTTELLVSTMLESGDADARARAALELLCQGDPPRAGHLFLLTESGLQHAAGQDGAHDAEFSTDLAALRRIAAECLDLECGDDVHTVTRFDSGDAPWERTVEVTSYEDPHGRQYVPVPLAAAAGQGFSIVGVAVLASSHLDVDGQTSDLASLVAKHLIESGQYVPMLAG
ncbi:MAG: protein kinase [Myxococcales bacterium]|nr:protein kinase [Myxococcales bacterium]